jgi:hypothetical protein
MAGKAYVKQRGVRGAGKVRAAAGLGRDATHPLILAWLAGKREPHGPRMVVCLSCTPGFFTNELLGSM